jgi:hypothetical protein
VELHLGVHEPTVPLRDLGPAFAPATAALNRMEQAGVALEAVGNRRTRILAKRVQALGDPRRFRYVSEPSERHGLIRGQGCEGAGGAPSTSNMTSSA